MSNEPPWRCDYHTDINIQMNYWLVDVANLSECFEPYAKLDPFHLRSPVSRRLERHSKNAVG